MEAIKLAPTLVPAAVLASKFESEAHQVRRSMRIVETAWLAQPHPDLADAYAHVKLGDSARQRLVRVETLAAKAPGHIEGALAIARAAIDASEFTARARRWRRSSLQPTQRVAMLMAEIERTEHGDSRSRPGLDLARGARAARSGLDRGRLCQRSLAAGIAGNRTAGRLPVADAGRGAAVRQGRCDRILSVRGSHAGGAAPGRRARAADAGPGRVGPACRSPAVVAPAPEPAPTISMGSQVAVPCQPPSRIMRLPGGRRRVGALRGGYYRSGRRMRPAPRPAPAEPARSGRRRCSGRGRTFQRPFQRRFRR